MLGSILAQVYRGQLSPHLTGVPAAARNAATGSITATEAVASRLGHAGLRLDQFGDAAFVHAMHVTTAISAVITLIGALVVLVWMPGRPAAQASAAQAETAGAETAGAETAGTRAAVAAVPAAAAEEVPAAVAAEAGVES